MVHVGKTAASTSRRCAACCCGAAIRPRPRCWSRQAPLQQLIHSVCSRIEPRCEGCLGIGPVKSALSVGFIFKLFPGASRPACCRQKRSWPFFCGSCPSGCHRKSRHDLRRGNPLELSVFWLVWRSCSGFLLFYVMGSTTMCYRVVEFRLQIYSNLFISQQWVHPLLLSVLLILNMVA